MAPRCSSTRRVSRPRVFPEAPSPQRIDPPPVWWTPKIARCAKMVLEHTEAHGAQLAGHQLDRREARLHC